MYLHSPELVATADIICVCSLRLFLMACDNLQIYTHLCTDKLFFALFCFWHLQMPNANFSVLLKSFNSLASFTLCFCSTKTPCSLTELVVAWTSPDQQPEETNVN